jgi:site-specific recombinase XerD
MPRNVRLLPTEPVSPITALVEEYLDEVAARARERTLEMYRTVLRRSFLEWLVAEGVNDSAQLDQRLVSRWITHLRERRTERGGRLAEESVRTYGRTVNSFLKWLSQRGQLGQVRAQTPARRRRSLEVLSPEEVDRIERAAVTERDRILIRLAFETGARLGELLELRERDLVTRDRRHFHLNLRGKTGDRQVPITPKLHTRLARYLAKDRPVDYHGDRFFVGLRRVEGTYQTPHRGAIEHMVKEAARKAGIQRRVHPHLFRHSAATHMLRQGMNPLLVADVLGHRDLSMIQGVYSHLTADDAHAALMKVLGGEDG